MPAYVAQRLMRSDAAESRCGCAAKTPSRSPSSVGRASKCSPSTTATRSTTSAIMAPSQSTDNGDGHELMFAPSSPITGRRALNDPHDPPEWAAK